MIHIVVYISGHGYGHAAQTLPILEKLWEQCEPFHTIFRSSLKQAFFAARYPYPFTLEAAEYDFGMNMNSAIDVDSTASAQRYCALHAQWEQVISSEMRYLQRVEPTLVLSNVGYLGLAAAQGCGIPSIAMSSLNWRDIFAHYCAGFDGAERVLADMGHAYLQAQCFIQMTPTMPMSWLPQRRLVGPVTRIGQSEREKLMALLGTTPRQRLVLVSLGGIASRVPIENWPYNENVHWLVPQEWAPTRNDMTSFQSVGMSFNTLLCSVDALVTKPGYGSFVEAGCNGIPVIYVRRGDWPEETYLTSWLLQHGRAVEITRDILAAGKFSTAFTSLDTLPLPPRPAATGSSEAAAIIAPWVR